jgi:alpha-glucoside transport system permease protein
VLSIFITSLIGIMKIFDIIYAMTGGNYGTNVLGLMFVNDYFKYGKPGQACAIIIILLLFIIPVIFYQIRIYKKQEELR